MAGDWIKLEGTTPDKPEVYRLAELLGVSTESVLGGLVRLWVWADQQSLDGNALSVTEKAMERISHVEGLPKGMLEVGWLKAIEGGYSIPNFDRHNGKTAKKRALTNKRVETHRKRESNAHGVTSALPEKKRSKPTPAKECLHPKGKRFSLGNAPPEWIAHCRAARPDLDAEFTFERFTRHWKAKSGRDACKLDWFATWQNWCTSERVQPGQKTAATGRAPTITCSACGKRVGVWTDGKCDPCWRLGQGIEARP